MIGNGITEIQYDTFCGCTSLKTLTIGSSVTTIHYTAFEATRNSSLNGNTLTCIDSIETIYINQSATSNTLKSTLYASCKIPTTTTIYYLAENVTLSLEEVKDDTTGDSIPGQYTLKLSGVDSLGADGVIYRFSSAQMKFKFADGYDITKIGALEITAAENISMLYQGNGEYAFYADPASNNEDCITAAAIELGTAVISGVGEFSLGLADSADYDTQVHGAYISDNIVNDFTYNGTTEFATGDTEKLYFAAVNGEIDLDTTALTIQIMFPNTVYNKSADYQVMQVYIDNMVTDDETITLGTPADGDTADGESDRDGTTVTYDVIDGTDYNGYTVVTEIAQGYTANVKFTGAGYRTCNTTIVPSDDEATLTVWNNVMEEATTVVSRGTGTGNLQTTFLAGDIVDDGIINIYDLSAALSYFGTETSTTAASKYSCYDLNRDGVIDSKDIAMVLVSYGF